MFILPQNPVKRKAIEFLPAQMNTHQSIILLNATALQESRYKDRKQINGPAVSFFQFEKIAIREVLTNVKTQKLAQKAIEEFAPAIAGLDVRQKENAIYALFQSPDGDVLAYIFARLNYWRVPISLPSLARETACNAYWNYYVSTWKPGRPHRHTWDEFFWRAFGAELG